MSTYTPTLLIALLALSACDGGDTTPAGTPAATGSADGERAAPEVPDQPAAASAGGEDTTGREVWAGETGYIRLSVVDPASSELLGSLDVLANSATQDAVAAGLAYGLQPGDERWTFSAGAWPAGALKLAPNLTLPPVEAPQVKLRHAAFPARPSPVTAPTPDGDDRLYALRQPAPAGAVTVGWLWVELDASGVASRLTWYKAVTHQGAFLKVTSTAPLLLEPASAGDVPANAYVLAQDVQGG